MIFETSVLRRKSTNSGNVGAFAYLVKVSFHVMPMKYIPSSRKRQEHASQNKDPFQFNMKKYLGSLATSVSLGCLKEKFRIVH